MPVQMYAADLNLITITSFAHEVVHRQVCVNYKVVCNSVVWTQKHVCADKGIPRAPHKLGLEMIRHEKEHYFVFV